MQTPTQVAKKAGVHAQTIRNYSSEFADLLSPGASGVNGARLYTNEDVEILCTIADLRRIGAPHDEIVARVRNNEVSPIVDVAPQHASNEPQMGLQMHEPAQLALQVGYNALQAQVASLARRLDARDAQAIRDAEIRGATLAIVGAGFVLLVLWLAVNGGAL